MLGISSGPHLLVGISNVGISSWVVLSTSESNIDSPLAEDCILLSLEMGSVTL